MVSTSSPGFFGKIPSNGDFLNRRIPRSFLDPWDEWLQRSVAKSKEQLGDKWLNMYLTAPIWRFILSAEICGDKAYAGVLMPSVDKVGRYFPLTIAVGLPKTCIPMLLACDMSEWFDKAEDLALSALDDQFDLAEFDRQVETLDVPVSLSGMDFGSKIQLPVAMHSSGKSTHVKMPAANAVTRSYVNLLAYMLTSEHSNHSIWWTNGSQRLQPSMLMCQNLPPSDGFSAFLDGEWLQRGWQNNELTPLSSSVPDNFEPTYESKSGLDPITEMLGPDVEEENKETSTADAPVQKIPADWEYPL